VREPPSGEGWIHEIKHDGYTLIVIDGGSVRAFSRNGRDWTGPYRRVVEAAGKLPCKSALIDGELIVQDENGISDFEARPGSNEAHKAYFSFRLGAAWKIVELSNLRVGLSAPTRRHRIGLRNWLEAQVLTFRLPNRSIITGRW
jgi:hypothetical protein